MTTQKYLFVCEYGNVRSPLAANLATEIAKNRGLEIETDYSGIRGNKRKKELREKLPSYDRTFVMEPWMSNRIRLMTKGDINPTCLDIYEQNYTDSSFWRQDPHLSKSIEKSLRRHI